MSYLRVKTSRLSGIAAPIQTAEAVRCSSGIESRHTNSVNTGSTLFFFRRNTTRRLNSGGRVPPRDKRASGRESRPHDGKKQGTHPAFFTPAPPSENGLITDIDALPAALAASAGADERAYIARLAEHEGLPFAVTPHFASLARSERSDPIRRQFFPDPREGAPDPAALADPLGEALHRAAPRLVHQYRGRALLLAGGTCAGFCRHCFRRVWLGTRQPFIGGAELQPALAYLSAHPEIREILVSGGDPLTADDEALSALFEALRNARPAALLRLCTRAPLTDPQRITEGAIRLFRRYRPLRLVAHINHPRELCEAAKSRLSACVEAGIPVHVQTVLLRGINDDPAVLAELFRACLDAGLTPYYLFQLDLAPGTRHFRVPLETGLALYRELAALISGLALPAYAVDLPGGGGKIRLRDGVIAGTAETPAGTMYRLLDANGKAWLYPADRTDP